MDRDVILALAPHYAAMLLFVFAAIGAWESWIGPLDLIGEFLLIAVVVFAYRPIVKRLGVAPDPWRD